MTMDIKSRFIKAYEDMSFRDLASAPVHALQGISSKDGELLYKAFSLRTVEDLANLKYARWAREICELAEYAPDTDMSSFKDKLDKKFEKKKPKTLAKSPVDALQGVSKKDALLLKRAFNVKTVQNLADLKYIRWAQEVVDMARPATVADIPVEHTRRPMRIVSTIVLVAIIALLMIFFWPHLRAFMSGSGTALNDRAIPPYGEQRIVERNEAKAPDVEPDAKPAETESAEVKAIEACPDCYTVKWRDTFINISERLSGDWRNWEKLYNRNRDRVKNTRMLIPGTQLKLPEGFNNAP